jgi:hypothetical protein
LTGKEHALGTATSEASTLWSFKSDAKYGFIQIAEFTLNFTMQKEDSLSHQNVGTYMKY